jgi:hypothetical protein
MSVNGSVINGVGLNGIEVLDEEVYQLWLDNPTSAIANLVEVDYNGTSDVYPNWVTYTLKSSDSAGLSFGGYPDRVKSVGSFSRQIGSRFTGVVSASIGEIEFYNTDGSLDNWHNLSFDGQKVRVLHGDPSWPLERFRLVFECIAEIASSSSQDTFKLRLRGVDYKSNLPLQTNLIGPTSTYSSSNLPIPKAYGKVFNIEPAVVDSVNLVYQWNDGSVTSVSDVRDGGVSFNTRQAVISAVSGNLITTSGTHGFFTNTRIRSDIGSLPAADLWYGSAWNGDIFCVIRSGANSVAVSKDGIKWDSVGTGLTGMAAWHAIAWNGAVFCMVAAGGQIATSPDGITWTMQTVPPAIGGWYAVCWTGTFFCAVGHNMLTAFAQAITSPDGVTWTLRTMPSSTATYTGVVWSGTTLCAIADSGTVAATSSDGITWAASTLPTSSSWTSIHHNGTVFCAISGSFSGSTAAATSTDGTTWTSRTLSSSHWWRSLSWNGSVFCAVALDASVATTSPDGITWTDRTLPGSANWAHVTYNGSVFCAITYLSTSSSVSSDGISWTASTGTLPTPLALSTDYWVSSDGLTATSFKVSATRGGSVLALTNTTTGGAIIGYHWTSEASTGKVYLDSKTAGKLTLNGIAGSTDAATIIVDVLSAINVDPNSKTRFQGICDQTIGIYVKDRRNRLDVANDVVSGIGAWYGYGRDGMLKFGRVEGNPASYDFTLTDDDMVLNSLQIESVVKPEKQHRLGLKKNWTNQSGALFAGVSADNRTLYSEDFTVSAAQSSSDVGANGSFHVLAVIPDIQPTMMAVASEALAEAVRLDAMYYGWGVIFSCQVFRTGSRIDIGNTVKVTHSRYNLSSGVNMTCVYVEDAPTTDKVTLKFFVALDGYAPGQL